MLRCKDLTAFFGVEQPGKYIPANSEKESVLPFTKVLGLILKFSFLKLYKDTTSERRGQVFGLVFPTFIFSFFILLIFLR